jgi:hypothetical protein
LASASQATATQKAHVMLGPVAHHYAPVKMLCRAYPPLCRGKQENADQGTQC